MRKAITLVCPECGERFTPQHHRAIFCSPAHSLAFNNRTKSRGGPAFPLAQVWRAARGSKDPAVQEAGRRAFAEFCRLVDAANTEDREAGRANPVALYRTRDAMNVRT